MSTWQKVGPMVAGCATRELAEHYARADLKHRAGDTAKATGWIIEESKRCDGTALFCAWLAVRHE